jgi:peptidyl-prolyl cis-trans isomerase C
MNARERAAAWLREPLVHFLAAGAAIFLITGPSGGDIDRTITVSEDQVRQLTSQWNQTWQRPPSAPEIDAMIRDYVKEEVFYREGLRLGLDKDDPVVRRRIRSKMEFLANSAVRDPSDADLQNWLDTHAARYVADPVFDFDQVFVASPAKFDTTLAELKRGTDAGRFGDDLSVPRSMTGAAKSDIAREFGDDFSAALDTLPVGRWAGPVLSGFGQHIVRVRAVKAPHARPLSQVRKAVENDWRNADRETRERDAFRDLLSLYDVKIERPR